jgi:hypothetical protein
VTRERLFGSSSRLLIAGLIAVRVVVLVLTLASVRSSPVGDAYPIRIQQLSTEHGTPYRDYAVEYAPLEFLSVRALAGADLRATATDLAVASFILDVGVFAVVAATWGRPAGVAYLLLGLPLLPLMSLRLDFLTCLLAVVAVWASNRGRQRSAGVALAAAILTKLWPVVLLPAFALERRWKAVWSTVGATAIGVLAWVVVGGIGAVREVTSFRGAHGWHEESTVGTWVWIATGGPLFFENGSTRVGGASALWRVALLITLVVLVAATWSRARSWSGSPFGWPALAATAALLALSPLFSQQYVAWLLPWAAVAATERHGEGRQLAGPLTFTIALATGALYLTIGAPGDWTFVGAQALLVVRNTACLGIVAVWLTGVAARSSARA